MTGLTKQQERALCSLRKLQSARMFRGITIETMQTDFQSINNDMQTADKQRREKLKNSEHALFALCGFTP